MSLPDCIVYILYLSIVQNGFTADLYNVSIPRSEKPSHGDRLPPNTNTNTNTNTTNQSAFEEGCFQRFKK